MYILCGDIPAFRRNLSHSCVPWVSVSEPFRTVTRRPLFLATPAVRDGERCKIKKVNHFKRIRYFDGLMKRK